MNASGHILVTGGAGFIGFHLCKRLLDKGCSVTAIDNLNDYYEVSLKKDRLTVLSRYSRFHFIKMDLTEKKGLEKLFQEDRPEVVVNLAAQAGVRYSIESPDTYIQSNIIGFFNILECCRYYPVKHLLFASSSSVYGTNKEVPYSVDDKADHPVSLYAATKKANEILAYPYSKLYGIPATGLRFFTVYGPFGRPDMAYFSFTKKILAGDPIQIFNQGDLYRDFTYIDDIIDGIDRMLFSPPKPDESGASFKLYNIGNHQPIKLLDFVQTLEDCIGKKAKVEWLPMQMGDVYQTYADIDDLIKDFGFYPKTSLRSGLNKFFQWYQTYENL